MLLEQQRKKKLIMARQEQDRKEKAEKARQEQSQKSLLERMKMQLDVLEEQRRRLIMVRQELEPNRSWYTPPPFQGNKGTSAQNGFFNLDQPLVIRGHGGLSDSQV